MKTFIEKYTLGVVILAAAILLVRGELLSTSLPVLVLQVVAVALVLSARFAFRSQGFNVTAHPGEGPLVFRGPYRFIRHPMYAGVLLFIWAGILGNLNLISALMGLVLLMFVLLRVSAEEHLLRARYADYEEYARHTKRLVPFLY